MSPLKHTVLHGEHATLGASFTDFGGWDMPLRYDSELDEHRAVRNAAGLFDLSHMGEVWVDGPDAATFLNSALAGNLAVVAVDRAKYSLLCQEDGGVIDDLICYRRAEDSFLLVPNAGNAVVVADELTRRSVEFDVSVIDASDETSLIAVQGPASVAILRELVREADHERALDMRYYSAEDVTVAGVDVLLARTGYTGEDGFELYVPNGDAAKLWRAFLSAGEAHGLKPAGLASRDSLRLEAGMPLYGAELSRDISPLAAGLGGIVSFKKEENFIGRAALETQRETKPARVLVGLAGEGRRAGRAGYAISVENSADESNVIGEITSGQLSPTLGHPIALAYIDAAYSEIGTTVSVDLRGKPQPYEVVKLPFYRRS